MIKGIKPRLAEAGKIKIGRLGEPRESKGGKTWRPPIKLDHFVITKTERDHDGDLVIDKDLMGALPKDPDGKIRAIPIMLHSDDIDEVFPTRYALYTGKKAVCVGDGEKATRKNKDGTVAEVTCTCDYLNADGHIKCKPNGTLHCTIAIPGHAVAGAVHKWRTTSIISIQTMIASLQDILGKVGTLREIPLWLRVSGVSVTPEGAPPSTVYCCHVELRADDIIALQRKALEAKQMREQFGLANTDYRALLTAPGDEPPEEQAEIAEEFYPDYETGEVYDSMEVLRAGTHNVRRKKEPAQEPTGEEPKQQESTEQPKEHKNKRTRGQQKPLPTAPPDFIEYERKPKPKTATRATRPQREDQGLEAKLAKVAAAKTIKELISLERGEDRQEVIEAITVKVDELEEYSA